VLLNNNLDLNSFDSEHRHATVEKMMSCIDEAISLGAQRLGLLSGPYPGEEKREQALSLLIASLDEICTYAEAKGNIDIILEVFDRTIDKKCLIGSTRDAVEVARELRRRHPNFGLMVDLSHLPLLGESAEHALTIAKEYLAHIHIGNCVLRDKSHPAYGDAHPRFGITGGEIDVAELREFLKVLLDIGYIDHGKRNIVAFEVRPLPGESSEAVIAGSKRTLLEAWASL
jgi:sugar phosphate isomerase/epimerase